MNAVISTQFRMKSYCKLLAIANTDNAAIHLSEHLYSITNTLHIWCTNKFHRKGSDPDKFAFRIMKASKLSSVCISFDSYVHCSNMNFFIIFYFVSQNYHSGTSSKNRSPHRATGL